MLETAAWTLAGFAGGYAVGRASVRLARDRPPGVGAPARRWTLTRQHILGVIVLALAVATIAQGVAFNRATHNLVQCQAAYNASFAEALEARTRSANQAQRSLDELIRTLVSDKTSTRHQRVQAVRHYLDSRAKAEAEKRDNPYPPPPQRLCE